MYVDNIFQCACTFLVWCSRKLELCLCLGRPSHRHEEQDEKKCGLGMKLVLKIMSSNTTSLERCKWISIVGCQAKGCLIGYFTTH
jgi:hypothetical protein